jgi:hypothetical protein
MFIEGPTSPHQRTGCRFVESFRRERDRHPGASVSHRRVSQPRRVTWALVHAQSHPRRPLANPGTQL